MGDFLKDFVVRDLLVDLLQVIFVRGLQLLQRWLHAVGDVLEVVAGLLADMLHAGFEVIQVLAEGFLQRDGDIQ